MPETILVVDDQRKPRELLATELREAGFTVLEASDGEEGWHGFHQANPDLVVTDMVMPRCDGLELLRRIRSRSDVPVIVFSGHGSVEAAADAFKAGADEFVSSLDIETDALVDLVRRTVRTNETALAASDLEDRLVGESVAIRRVRSQVAGAARLAAPVLVSGEAGTGRSTVIRALHELGSSANGGLVRVDAAAFSPEFEFPDRGALHLDGLEYLSPEAQTYWLDRLRKDEARSFSGCARVLASTQVPARSGNEASGILPDLWKILSRFRIDLPAVRDRAADVPHVARAMAKRIGASVGRSGIRLSPASLEYLSSCRLPGNLRQLEQLIERAIAFSRGRVIRKQTLQEIFADLEDSVASIREERRGLERQRLIQTLRETGGNISHTAEVLGKSRGAIYRLIHKYEIPLARSR